MKTTLLSLILTILRFHASRAQNFHFDKELKNNYKYAVELEKRIQETDGLLEMKIKRMAHPLDYLYERHYYFSNPDKKDYRLSVFFCKNQKNAEEYAKGVFDGKESAQWAIQDGILIVITSKNSTIGKEKLAYFAGN